MRVDSRNVSGHPSVPDRKIGIMKQHGLCHPKCSKCVQNKQSDWPDLLCWSKKAIWLVKLHSLWGGFERYFRLRVTKVPFLKSCLGLISFISGGDREERMGGDERRSCRNESITSKCLSFSAKWWGINRSYFTGKSGIGGRRVRCHLDHGQYKAGYTVHIGYYDYHLMTLSFACFISLSLNWFIKKSVTRACNFARVVRRES